jgi:hypothetical protein
MAEIRHAVTWCRRLLHLRARGFADVGVLVISMQKVTLSNLLISLT